VARRESCDAFIAVGGGSAIDTAKVVNLYCASGPNRPAVIESFLSPA
jgi:alcohol dehydrogenase class IV